MAALIFLALTLPACQLPGSSKGSLKNRGDWSTVRAQVKCQLAEKQMTGGAFADAARTLDEAIALDPTQSNSYAGLAEAQLELGNLASAQETLDAARQQNLSSAALAYMQGVLDEQREQIDSAHEHYAAARQLDTKNVDYVVAEAETLVEQDRPRDALALLQAARGKVDDEATIELLAARVATLVGEREQAVRHYRAALSAQSDHFAAREELALLLVQMKRCSEALPLLNEAIDRNPETYGAVFRALTQCLIESADPEGAVAVIKGYLQSHPTDGAAHLLLAQAALATDDLLTARTALDAASRHSERRSDVEILHAVVDLKSGDYDRAESRLAALGESDADDPDVLCLIGELRLSQQRSAEARTYFERALRADPGSNWAKRRIRETG